MPISVNWSTKRITVPQSYCTLITGTLYELDTDVFRKDLKDLEDAEEGIVFIDTHRHNTAVTVAGTTFARTIEIINGYSVEFTPDAAWSVRLVGSNNNIFDIQNGILIQNQVQVIPTNSAGLIVGEGADPQDVADAVWNKDLVEAMSGSGTTGERFGKLLTLAKFLGLK